MREQKIPAPPVARFEWSLHVDCPKCKKGNDLASPEHDGEFDIAKHIFNNNWDALKGWEVTCEHCGHEFTIEKVEY
jgi:ribosomal protein S27E